MKEDFQKNEERYKSWRKEAEKGIKGISETNLKLMLQYLDDMELGKNVGDGSPKKGRSYSRLNTLKGRMIFLITQFEQLFKITDLSKLEEDHIMALFRDMKNGTLKKKNGEIYKSVQSYFKIFSAFWHWHQKSSKKNGTKIIDITEDLNVEDEKPQWVYLKDEEIRRLANASLHKYKVLVYFMYDTGMRPEEAFRIRVYDLSKDYKEVNIREEIAKSCSFGRKFKLMLFLFLSF